MLATGRDTAISVGAGSPQTGVGAFRLMTLGGEFTPETKGAGSSAWTTDSAGGGHDGSGGGDDGVGVAALARTGDDGFDGAGVGGLISTDGAQSTRLSLESDFFTS